MTDGVWLVVGLGNPGPTYERTRHNVGQFVVDELADRFGSAFSSHKSGNRIAAGRIRSVSAPDASGATVEQLQKVVVAKPDSFMNLSGGPTAGLAHFYHSPVQQIIVVHDDLDVPLGRIKIKQGGSDGGHNGLKDITKALGSPDYLRVRVGIGRPPGRMDPASFVLKPFNAAERDELITIVPSAADAVSSIISDGLAKSQGLFHSQK